MRTICIVTRRGYDWTYASLFCHRASHRRKRMRRGGADLQDIRPSHQISQGLRSHLSNDVGAKRFNGPHGDSDLSGNLLIQKADSHQSHDLVFALREGPEFGSQIGNSLSAILPDSVAFERNLDCIQHILIAKWLGQEVDRSRFHGSYGRGDVTLIGHEDNRNLAVRLGKLGLK